MGQVFLRFHKREKLESVNLKIPLKLYFDNKCIDLFEPLY